MFWGLALLPGKKYSRTLESSIRLTNIVLDPTSNLEEIVSVYVESQDVKVNIGNLGKKINIYQLSVDLEFVSGDEIGFFIQGADVPVHLSGYVVMDQMCEDHSDDEGQSEEEDDEIPHLVNMNGKRQPFEVLKKSDNKKMKLCDIHEVESDDDDDLEEEEDDNKEDDNEEEEDDNEEEEDNDGEEDDNEDDNEDEDEEESEDEKVEVKITKKESIKAIKGKKTKTEVTTPTGKKNKENAQKTPQLNGSVKKSEQGSSEKLKSPKSEKNKRKSEVNGTPQTETTPKAKSPQNKQKESNDSAKKPKKVIKANGVIVEDLKVGDGPQVKKGKFVSMYYEGRLKNNKVFDKTVSGPPFKFRLGAGEVIKGWDIGIDGMKVGGKRKLTIPPHVAYGKSGAPPAIPPNSTLIFEVEMKGMK